MTDELKAEREMFDSWWRASKYCQVIIPSTSMEQIAWDGWQSRAKLDRTHTTGGDVDE